MQTKEQTIADSTFSFPKNIPSDIFNSLISIKGNYFVGGFVRDRFLKRNNDFDIDMVVSDIKQVLNILRSSFKAHIVELDRDFGVYRVFLKGMDYYLDISRMQGKDILDDLSRRDFTINAIAVEYKNGCSKTNIIDPYNGMTDIEKGIIRVVSRKNLVEDPLRLLRAFRFQSQLNFQIDAETRKYITELSFLINYVAKERVKTEIFKILKNSSSAHIFRDMESSLFRHLFPFFEVYKGFYGGKGHCYDIYEHSYHTLENIENFINNGFPLDFDKNILNEELEYEFKVASALKLAAFLHDVGKILTKDIISNKITFYGHDKKGAEFLNNFLTEARFANSSIKLIVNLVKYHTYLFNIIQSDKNIPKLSPRAYMRIKDTFGTLSPLLFFLSIADNLAKGEDKKIFLELVKKLYDDFLVYASKENNSKKPILTGRDIIRILNIDEGPIVGEIIKDIREKDLVGFFKDRSEAEGYIKEKYGQKA